MLRLAVARFGGWLLLHWGGTRAQVFVAQAVALVLLGLVNAGAVAGGAWFGPLVWPRRAWLPSQPAQGPKLGR
ncbi:MAG TPA: hypothetical protein VET87_07380 [Rubrivivax sp.]|nr:hypothetical protein [Rubrivivax sp.]